LIINDCETYVIGAIVIGRWRVYDVAIGIHTSINPVNDAITVTNLDLNVNEDNSITFTEAELLALATNVDGDTLSVTDVSYTGQGVLSITTASLTEAIVNAIF
jgi:hypothetical protein